MSEQSLQKKREKKGQLSKKIRKRLFIGTVPQKKIEKLLILEVFKN